MGVSQIQSGAKMDPGLAAILSPGGGVSGQGNSRSEEEVVRLVAGLYGKAKQWKETWAKDHPRFWNLWESNHYKGRISHTLTQAVVNMIWSAVETFVGHVSDTVPDPIARARKPEFRDKAKLLTKWLKYEHDSNDIEQEIQHPIRSACVTGAGWMAVDWDENRLGGRGDVRVSAVDERFMFPAPYARNLAEALYVIEAKNVPRDFVVATWERGERVPPGARDLSLSNLRAYSEANRQDSTAPNYSLFKTTTGSDSHWSASSPGGSLDLKQSDLVTLHKCYVRQKDGSMRLIVVANGVLLSDDASPYDDDDFPHVVFNILPTLDTLQGRGLVQFVEGLQEILNASLSYLLDQQRFASDPMLIVSQANIEDGQLVDNSPGAVLPDSDPNRVGYSWLTAPGFNQAWVSIQEMVTGYMDSVLGRVDVLKGESPSGVTTLGGLEIIRDEANVRLRSLIRWVKASMKRMDLLILSRLRQFAKDERTLRIEGRNGQEEFVSVNPVTDIGPSGEASQDETFPENAEFDVEFNKEIPGGRQARIELALTLAGTPAEDGLPMVDRQKVLEEAEYEDAPEIMERMARAGQAQSDAQAAAEAAKAGQPPPQASPQEQDPSAAVMDLFAALDQGGQAA